ncbi:terminase small subunit [Agrobacterium genomosp. 2]|uniref:Phage DNA packaging protein Nu1 n=1 Tax=Agrobacterium genomosp. 2 str. CFBP 5494 TaxID=1183436 RepID=A0A9W5AZ87_9HYPH|nr:terminase small subunit [Agrobacterium genomosp. 2]CUW87506.1 hypothetical protein AGR2A_Cc120075 [Agrobacterium genomosp. 2 str. CFBP 5494]
MARRKTADPIMKDAETDAENTESVSIPPDDTAPPASKREAAKLRTVSVKQCSLLLNRDRNTIQKWLDQGCPFVTHADRNLGVAWELDLAEVVRWLEERAARTAAEKFGDTEDGKMSKEEADRRKAVAGAVVAELEMVEKLRTVIPISTVLDLWAKDYSEIKAKAMSLGDKIAVSVDPSISDHVRAIAERHMREVMATLKTEKSLLNWS